MPIHHAPPPRSCAIAILIHNGTSSATGGGRVGKAWNSTSDATTAWTWNDTSDLTSAQPYLVIYVAEPDNPEPDEEALPCPDEPAPEIPPGWRPPIHDAAGRVSAECWPAVPRARAPPRPTGQGGPARKTRAAVA
jgi:hypothetical protein